MEPIITQASLGGGSPELTAALIGILILGVAAAWAFAHWLTAGPVSPDPWDAETAAALANANARPICHRCLRENDPQADFCEACGATIGQYTNWLPYPYIFSLGHTLRIGSAGEYRRAPWLVCGFLLLSAAEYVIFAPIYWFMMLRGLRAKKRSELTPPEPLPQ